MVVVDHPANVEALAAAAAKAGKPLTVIVDIDPGIHRTGVATPDGVVELVQKVVEAEVAEICRRAVLLRPPPAHRGLRSERKASIEERTEYLKGILAKLEAAGLKPGIVTGSGTGTHFIDAKLGVFTELQVGSYVFMDHDYNVCDLRGARQADLRAGAADRCARGERQHAGHGDGRCRPEGDGDREGPAA